LARSKSSAKSTRKSVLSRTIDFFTKSPYHAYLVGGYVRDTALGLTPLDIDIVVEGDAIKVGRDLNKVLKGNITTHREFGTASIIVHDQCIDLVSARVEKYPEPAKLPHVYPSTINEDLNRRDFTINAMAMSIARENFGEIFDPFDGLGDIKKGIIRILHRNSFIDDPTRVFRALRYKNRFGFRLEKNTRQLMQETIQNKLIKKLSGKRLLTEIRLIFQESTYGLVLRDLSEFNIFKLRKKDHDTIIKLANIGLYYYLSVINVHSIPLSTQEQRFVRAFRSFWKIVGNLEKASRYSTFYRILHPLPREIIDCIQRVRANLKPKVDFYKKSLKRKRFLSGNDLKRLKIKGKNRYQTIITNVWYLQLDNKIKSRKEALAYVKKIS
jgi:tRNA nucleotidyltransferase (CCA-adding enzyme)